MVVGSLSEGVDLAANIQKDIGPRLSGRRKDSDRKVAGPMEGRVEG